MMAFVNYYKTITWFGILFPLLLCGSPAGTTPFQYCTNYLGEEIEDGVQFIPNADDLCYRCTCDGGYPVACSSVFCSPPDCKLYEVVEDECCKFICLEAADEPDVININDTGEPVLPKDGLEYLDSANLPLRLVASTVTSFLILALLLFMVHRLRQRRTLIMLRRLNAERQEEDTVAYLPQMDNLDIGIEFPPYEDPPPPYTPPKPPYIPEGEAPPPYDEPNGHIINADNHVAQSAWVEGDIRQCNGQATQASSQPAPAGMRKDEAVQANHLGRDNGLDSDPQGRSISCTLDAFHSCGSNIAQEHGRHQSCSVSSSREQTCVSSATVYTAPCLAAGSASHRLELNHLESLGHQHANCLLSDSMTVSSERSSDTNSSCKPVYLGSGASCCNTTASNDNIQRHTEAFSESDDRYDFDSAQHNSHGLLKQACMNGKQLAVEVNKQTSLSMYPHHWNDGIHCAGTNNASAWSTIQAQQRNSRADHLALSAEKHLASLPANQCGNEHRNLPDSQLSFAHTHTSCEKLSSASYISHSPDGMNSSPCCHSINTDASSSTPSRDPAVNHSLAQAATPGHHMVSRSGSVTSQASLLSVCSETGERKRPPLSLPCQVLGPDLQYPDSPPLSHLSTREDLCNEGSVHCRYLGISDPAVDDITLKSTTKSVDVNRDYSNLSHTESASNGMPLEHTDLQHIEDNTELTGFSSKSTSSMQGPVLPHSAEPSFSPNPGSDHQSRTKKRRPAGLPGSGDQSTSCNGDAVNDVTQQEMPQFKQYGFIDDPEVLMAFKDNTVYPEAGDKVLSTVLFEKLCSQSQSSERPAYNSLDQNSSGYSSKSLTNDRSDDSSVEQTTSREHTPHGLCEPNENIDNRPKLESSKVNLMYLCMNKSNEQGKARMAKHRKRHKSCTRQCKSKSRSTETTQHSKHLADKDSKDILNNNKLDNYAALSTVSVSTSTEKIPDDEFDNLSNQIIDPERCISSDPDYSDR